MQWRNHLFGLEGTGINLLEFKIDYYTIRSAGNLKVAFLRFVRVVDVSMSHVGRDECGMPTVSGLPLSATLTGVCGAV